jgi:hypothetical protein
MKQCPKCNYSCEDSDVICKNCGFLFNLDGSNIKDQFDSPRETQYSNSASNSSENQPFGINNQYSLQNNGLAIAAFVLGIIAVVFACCDGIGAIPGIVALILGIISLRQINNSRGAQKGKNLAIAGIIMGGVGILIGVYFIVVLIANRGRIADFMQQYSSLIQKYQSSSNS